MAGGFVLRIVQGIVQDSHILYSIAVREFCVNQYCTVMHSTAYWSIGRPGNSLISKDQTLYFAD